MDKKSYKTKLNITSNKQLNAFRKMAGCYRAVYNASLDMQVYRRVPCIAGSMKNAFFTSEELLDFMRKVKKKYACLNQVDSGIFNCAVLNASRALLTAYRWEVPKFMSRKQGDIRFQTSGKVKVFYDHITIPKLGKVRLFEKGYLPQGKKYSDIAFTYDGNEWWISLSVKEHCETKELNKGTELTIDFDSEGNLHLGSQVIPNATQLESYQKELKKLKKLSKKLKRQSFVNTKRRILSFDFLATKGKHETVKAIKKSKVRLDNIKRDYFRKIACEVARTKPEKAHVLSVITIGTERNGYLTRKLRETSTKEFFNILVNKLRLTGTRIDRHLRSDDLTALGSRVLTAYGGLTSTTPECERNQFVEVGSVSRHRAEEDANWLQKTQRNRYNI